MDEEEAFSDDEMKTYAEQLERILSENSPRRDKNSYPYQIKWGNRVVSPYPGNLQDNGTVRFKSGRGYTVKHGYAPAPYALYANKTSRKRGYIQKSIDKFRGFLENKGWEDI